jgi:hypothetical protein
LIAPRRPELVERQVERVGAKLGRHRVSGQDGGIVGVPEPPEIDRQAGAVVQVKDQAMFLRQMLPVGQQDLAAHPQAHQQPTARRLDLEPLAPGRHVADFSASQCGLELLDRHVQAPGLQYLDPGDGPADQLLPHVAGKDGDFR